MASPWLPETIPGLSDVNSRTDTFNQLFLRTMQNAPDPLQSPAFKQIQDLLMAPKTGGLSANLETLMGIGEQHIARGLSSNIAGAQTRSFDRGMEGSSIESHEIAGAVDASEQARAQLLASLLGVQERKGSEFAGLLSQFGPQLEEQRMNAFLKFLQDSGESAANIDFFRTQMDSMMNEGKKNRQQQLISSIIGGGSSLGSSAILGKMLGK